MSQYELKLFSDRSENVPYNDPDYPVYSGGAWLHEFAGMGLVHHWHDDLEFSYVLHGQMTYNVGGEVMTLYAGEGVFVNSRQMHRNYSVDGADGEYRCILFHPSMVHMRYPGVARCVQRIAENESFPYIKLDRSESWQRELLHCLEELHPLIQETGETKLIGIYAQLFHIIQLLLDHMPANDKPPAADLRVPTLRKMVGYIQQYYAEKITLDDICLAGSVGTSTCNNLFKKHFDLTPLNYLLRYRLQKAAELLKSPRLSVSEIAYSTGFSGASYFTKCFHREFSQTPSEYRRQLEADSRPPYA